MSRLHPSASWPTLTRILEEGFSRPRTKINRHREWGLLSAYLKSPKQVASFCNSSSAVAAQICKAAHVDSKCHRVIELGPGSGAITQKLLHSMPNNAQLLAIEKTQALADKLLTQRDPRVRVIVDDASQLVKHRRSAGWEHCDAVVSGIPFSYLAPETASRIVTQVHEALRVGGKFVAYQLHADVSHYANPVFGPGEVVWEWRNMPPLRIFTWTKR
ncbi:MAG: methyltransferase domain-containing protein [Planctomycetota bacterium]